MEKTDVVGIFGLISTWKKTYPTKSRMRGRSAYYKSPGARQSMGFLAGEHRIGSRSGENLTAATAHRALTREAMETRLVDENARLSSDGANWDDAVVVVVDVRCSAVEDSAPEAEDLAEDAGDDAVTNEGHGQLHTNLAQMMQETGRRRDGGICDDDAK
ncbi:MAG: hypothetical protein M1819_004578 [Sarea resinae]|nr:MAG: hypothetical protein M1819_006818 [Sarea resinae]KAI9832034.1 MAG: hypothetical protein M1819_004578 [Sarea resinae]